MSAASHDETTEERAAGDEWIDDLADGSNHLRFENTGERFDELTQRLVNLLTQQSGSLRNGRKTAEQVLLTVKSRIIELESAAAIAEPLETLTSAELDAGVFELDYLIPGLLVKGQPCILAGPKKSLKTNISIDLTLSLASGCKFLDHFYVSGPVRTALISGESGTPTIQETARRVAKSKSWPNLADYENAFWCFTLPKLGQPNSVKTMVDYVNLHRLDVLVIDPAYLAMPLGDSASNLFLVGAMLGELSQVHDQTGVTIILCHHARKAGQGVNQYDPPELESIAWAGFQEWARQWILLGRRAAYNPDSNGQHELWLASGGSAGHSGLWAVDIEEGTRNGDTGRKWVVDVKKPYEAKQEEREAKEQAKYEQEQIQEAANRDKLLKAYKIYPEGETSNVLRTTSGLSGEKFRVVNARLISDGMAELCTIQKNKRSENAFRLTEIGRSDTVGHGRTNQTQSDRRRSVSGGGRTSSPPIGELSVRPTTAEQDTTDSEEEWYRQNNPTDWQ